MPTARPILVTGSHRSGTGWVGSMIAASKVPHVAYLWEPFSVVHRPGVCAASFPLWFPYVCDENAGPYVHPVQDMLDFRYAFAAELRALRTPKDAGRMVRDVLRFRRFRQVEARPLLKDPIAIFSAEWLGDRFDMDVIVLIRHPAAFVNSIKSRRLRHPFDHFLRQPLLMRDLLAPFEDDIARFASSEQPLLDQGILLWRLIHHVIASYRDRRPGWDFLRLEDLARRPQEEFRRLYRKLELTYDPRVAAVIDEHTSSANRAEEPDPGSHRRHSRASVLAWKARLSPDETERIRTAVEPISKEFYTDADW